MFQTTLNKSIKVFSQLYVGVKPQYMTVNVGAGKFETVLNPTPLAFATPLEQNQAGLKRQETVKSWLKTHIMQIDADGKPVRDEKGHNVYVIPEPDIRTLDNVPRSGFKITDDIKRVYWGGGNVVFRVLDPAGFELEIQSSNLMALIQVSGINSGGEIPGQCVWGRDGKNNVLLHEKSEEYKNAILKAESTSGPKQIAKTDRIVGAKYVAQDGSTCTYLGKVWVAQARHDRVSSLLACDNQAQSVSATTREIVEVVDYEAIMHEHGEQAITPSHFITFYKKAPLIKIVENCTLSKSEVEQYISTTPRIHLSFASGSRHEKEMVFVSVDKPTDVKFAVKPISKDAFDTRSKEVISYSGLSHIAPITTLKHFLNSYYSKFMIMSDQTDHRGLPKYNSDILEIRTPRSFVGNTTIITADKFFGRIIVDDKRYTVFADDGYNSSSYGGSTLLGRCADVAEKCPVFNNVDEVKEYLNTLYEQGRVCYPAVVDTAGTVQNLLSII